MILQREHYTELPWWKWAQLRMILAWARLFGGFARAVGVDRLRLKSTASIARRQFRRPPIIQAKIIESEMLEAEAICPTGAVFQDKKKAWNINVSRCISCGLCYLRAPQSLAPAAESASIQITDQHKITDFAKI
jgi:ferredoxin